MNNWGWTLGTGVALAEHLEVEAQEEEGGLFLLGTLLPPCLPVTSLFIFCSCLILSLLKVQNAMMVVAGFLEFNRNQYEN